MKQILWIITICVLSLQPAGLVAAEKARMTWATAKATLTPYDGPSVKGVDVSTLNGKVVAGYQGWFATTNDGGPLGWTHYPLHSKEPLPTSICIDFWPDVSELDPDEKCVTPFVHTDGQPAYLFSSRNPKTVNRHFQWMRQYGIDAAFVQRFAHSVMTSPARFENSCRVLANCRAGANQNGVGYIVMYDLSGMPSNAMERVKDDWRMLVDGMKITRDPKDKAYLYHQGKPLVAVWGIGFKSTVKKDRDYSLAECADFVNFLQHDPRYGGCSVMIGIPTGWRTGTRDSVNDPAFLELIKQCQVISPWTPGRYRNLAEVTSHAEKYWRPDADWCKTQKIDYLPVVFPGFSWHNKTPDAPTDAIPRLKGKFLWQQYYELAKLNIPMVYQAMFDEMDEGTQIFKVTNNPPKGAPFLTYEGLPADFYLKLVGAAAKMIRHEVPATPVLKEDGVTE
jgi:hypothetical protein